MARQVKRFGEHSQRWQKDQLAKGIDPKRWDRWRSLSAKMRKVTNPFEYGKGEDVRTQVRKPLLDAAVNRIVAVHNGQRGVAVRSAAVRRNLNHPDAKMSNARLRRITTISPQRLARQIDESLSRRYSPGERSPFWYEKRG